MSTTNFTSVDIVISEQNERGAYDFTVKNNGDLVLWYLRIVTYDLLGPGTFGLDDTHMPTSLTRSEPAINIERLSPGEAIVVRRKKWGTLDQYEGPASGTFYATFSPHADSSEKYGLRGTFIVRRKGGTPFVAPPALLDGIKASYKTGHAAALWLKRVLSKR